MATERKGSKATGTKRTPSPRDRSVRVWSSVGLTIAVTDDPPQFLKVEFGHERIASRDSVEEIRKTARLIDEFNEAEVSRHVEKYRKLVEGNKPKAQANSAKARHRRRLKKMQEDDALDRAEEDTWD